MEPVYLTALSSQRLSWLAARQATIAENIANANTPRYRAREIEPFSAQEGFRLAMAATRPNHMVPAGLSTGRTTVRPADGWQVSVSGNSVSLEEEMLKQTSVTVDHTLAASILRGFHRMALMSVKG